MLLCNISNSISSNLIITLNSTHTEHIFKKSKTSDQVGKLQIRMNIIMGLIMRNCLALSCSILYFLHFEHNFLLLFHLYLSDGCLHSSQEIYSHSSFFFFFNWLQFHLKFLIFSLGCLELFCTNTFWFLPFLFFFFLDIMQAASKRYYLHN